MVCQDGVILKRLRSGAVLLMDGTAWLLHNREMQSMFWFRVTLRHNDGLALVAANRNSLPHQSRIQTKANTD